MVYFILFVFGLAIGSFMNVLALRYDGEHNVFDAAVIGGRSHCPHCKRTLRWFELIPVFSFFAQGGKCRRCGVRISWQYPAVEFLSACIFAFVSWHFAGAPWFITALWIIAFEILLLMTCIDLRLSIIPDELTIILGVVAIIEAIVTGNVWLSHILGGVFGVAFFGALALVTRGKGMGMGDVKLALPLGFLFGWPNMLLLCGTAFVVGALVGVVLLARGRKKMKSAVPFAPFLAIGAVCVFFFAVPLIGWYFSIMGL